MKFAYYFIKNYLSKEQIKSINNIHDEKGTSFNNKANTTKTSICHQIPYSYIKIIKDIRKTIHWINREAFGVETYPEINTDEFIRNIYQDTLKGEYDWHFDSEPFDFNYTIKLTTLINLSEDIYEGGEFLLWDGKPITIKEYQEPGTLLTFPSFLLHKVNPVIKGKRISGTYFLTGPKWK